MRTPRATLFDVMIFRGPCLLRIIFANARSHHAALERQATFASPRFETLNASRPWCAKRPDAFFPRMSVTSCPVSDVTKCVECCSRCDRQDQWGSRIESRIPSYAPAHPVLLCATVRILKYVGGGGGGQPKIQTEVVRDTCLHPYVLAPDIYFQRSSPADFQPSSPPTFQPLANTPLPPPPSSLSGNLFKVTLAQRSAAKAGGLEGGLGGWGWSLENSRANRLKGGGMWFKSCFLLFSFRVF